MALIYIYTYLCDNIIFFCRFVNGYAENLSNICSFSGTTSVYSWKCKGKFLLWVHLSVYIDSSGIKVFMPVMEITEITYKWKRLKTKISHDHAVNNFLCSYHIF